MLAAILLAATIQADPRIMAAIAKIKAVDNHAHPLRVTAADEVDRDADALSIDGLDAFGAPVPLRPENPEWIHAWQALYGYKYNDAKPEHVRELLAAKQRTMQVKGDGYPAWVLDRIGIETMFANRVALGRGLASPRFRWVSFVDALLFPLNNASAKSLNPDYEHFYGDEERLLQQYLRDGGFPSVPATLGDYLDAVVTPTLERQKKGGAIAIKFEAAYLRTLDFSNPSKADAARVYARYAGGERPPDDDYKLLQTTSSATSPAKPDGSRCPCTSTSSAAESAATSAFAARSRCCSIRSSTTRRCARRTSSWCTAGIRGRRKWRCCWRSRTSTPTFPRRHSCSIRAS